MLSVRAARPEDLPAVLKRSVETAMAQLVTRDLANATQPGVTAMVHRMYQMTLAAPGGIVLVADWPAGDRDEGPAAYALLMPQANPFTGAAEVVVMDIFTAPKLRGQGVGRTLLQAAGQYARSVGADSLMAQVALSNQSSLRMFLGDGFTAERAVLGRRC